MICKFRMPALSLSQPFPACELSCSPRKVMKGEVARQLQSTTFHGGCGAQSTAGHWKARDFLFQLIKACELLCLFQKFDSSIVPTANSSWIILGFGVDNHMTQEVLDPISSSLDRIIFNSGAKSPASVSLLCYGTWSKSLCEGLSLGPKRYIMALLSSTLDERAGAEQIGFLRWPFLPDIYRWPQLEESVLYERPFSCVSCMNFMSKSICTKRNVNLLGF